MNVQCSECKNDKKLEKDGVAVGRWFECDYCGTTYEITSVRDDGAPTFEMIEDEK